MLQHKIFIWLLSIFTVASVSVGTAVLISSKSADSKPAAEKQELKGSGSSDNGKSAHKAAPPFTTTTVAVNTTTTTAKPTGNDKPKDNKGKGNNNGNEKDFTISGTAPDLYPGAVKQLTLTVNNPNNFAIKVTALSVTTSAASNAGCTTSSVTTDSFTGALIVDKNSSASTPLAIRMAESTPNACQGADFTLVYSGIGEKA